MGSGGDSTQGTLYELGQRADHSWLRDLTVDPESDAQMPNKVSRQVCFPHPRLNVQPQMPNKVSRQVCFPHPRLNVQQLLRCTYMCFR
jgi:hypothetical protein